jgi:hypothetical protein
MDELNINGRWVMTDLQAEDAFLFEKSILNYLGNVAIIDSHRISFAKEACEPSYFYRDGDVVRTDCDEHIWDEFQITDSDTIVSEVGEIGIFVFKRWGLGKPKPEIGPTLKKSSAMELGLSGSWMVIDYHFPPVGSTTEREARGYLEKIMYFSETNIQFDEQECQTEEYFATAVDADVYLYGFRMLTSQMGISRDELQILFVDCTIFGLNQFIMKSPHELIHWDGGVFYDLVKLTPGEPSPTLIPRSTLPPTPTIYCTPDGNYDYFGSLKDFLNVLRPMILEAQKEEVGSIIYYPIIVQINNERMEISNKEEFLRHYDEIISTDVITAVQNTTDPEDVSVSWRGAVIDRRISFDWCYDDESLCSKQIKIIGINN